MINFNKTMYGRRVRFTSAMAHETAPEFYPEVGTVGFLISPMDTSFAGTDYVVDEPVVVVQWPKGSTSKKDLWLTDLEHLELVEDNDNMKAYVVTCTNYKGNHVVRVFTEEQEAIDYCRRKNKESVLRYWDYELEDV